MGRDKARVALGDGLMVDHVVTALREAGASPVALVGHRRPWSFEHLGVVAVADQHPDAGPLGGIVTALTWSPAPLVAVVACDLPDLAGSDLARLVTRWTERPDADVVALVGSRGIEPLAAVWDVRAAPQVAGRFAAGDRAVRAAFDHLDVETVTARRPDGLRNVNTPEDLAEARRGHPPSPGVLEDQPAVGVDTMRARGRETRPQTNRGAHVIQVPEIDVHELAERRSGGGRVVDVREPDEWAEVRVPGVPLVPLAEVPDRVADFTGDGPVHVICRSGGRSHQAAEFLRAQGIDAVNVAGGTLAWVEAGFPTEHGAAGAG